MNLRENLRVCQRPFNSGPQLCQEAPLSRKSQPRRSLPLHFSLYPPPPSPVPPPLLQRLFQVSLLPHRLVPAPPQGSLWRMLGWAAWRRAKRRVPRGSCGCKSDVCTRVTARTALSRPARERVRGGVREWQPRACARRGRAREGVCARPRRSARAGGGDGGGVRTPGTPPPGPRVPPPPSLAPQFAPRLGSERSSAGSSRQS